MGRMYAEGLAESGLGLGLALSVHLSSNHYPPVPQDMVPVCIAAIEAGNEGEWDRLIDLPEGVEYKDGRTAVEASVLIESLHLDAFLDGEDEWYDEDDDDLL